MLTSGRLSERVIIQRPIETELPSGSIKKGWTTIHIPFCDVVEKDAGIDTIATLENIPQVFIITTRFNPEVHYIKGDRIIWRDREMKIHSLKVDKMRTQTTIVAKAHNETTQM